MLVGQPPLPTDHPITGFAWAPLADETFRETFWAHMIRHKDARTAYAVAKVFNNIKSLNVQLIVYSNDGGKWYWQELDTYLISNRIKRFYIDPSFNIPENEKEHTGTGVY